MSLELCHEVIVVVIFMKESVLYAGGQNLCAGVLYAEIAFKKIVFVEIIVTTVNTILVYVTLIFV